MTTIKLLVQIYPYYSDYSTKKIPVSEVLSNTEVLICMGAVILPLLITAYLLWKVEND